MTEITVDVPIPVFVYPGDDGYTIAECPALPGVATQGRTRDEALANVREAIEGWLDVSARLDTAAVAELVGVQPATITSYLSHGRIPQPCHRTANGPVWTRAAIEEWVSTRPGRGKGGGRPPMAATDPRCK